MVVAISAAAFAVAAVAVAWPYLPRAGSGSALSASERSRWVTRLFDLAEKADEPAVSSAARALISALVSGPDQKRAR
jgi:hypothetical protein